MSMSESPDSFSYHYSRTLAEQAMAEVKPEVTPSDAEMVTNVFQMNLREGAYQPMTRAKKRPVAYWADSQSQAYRQNLPSDTEPTRTTFNRSL